MRSANITEGSAQSESTEWYNSEYKQYSAGRVGVSSTSFCRFFRKDLINSANNAVKQGQVIVRKHSFVGFLGKIEATLLRKGAKKCFRERQRG